MMRCVALSFVTRMNAILLMTELLYHIFLEYTMEKELGPMMMNGFLNLYLKIKIMKIITIIIIIIIIITKNNNNNNDNNKKKDK